MKALLANFFIKLFFLIRLSLEMKNVSTLGQLSTPMRQSFSISNLSTWDMKTRQNTAQKCYSFLKIEVFLHKFDHCGMKTIPLRRKNRQKMLQFTLCCVSLKSISSKWARVGLFFSFPLYSKTVLRYPIRRPLPDNSLQYMSVWIGYQQTDYFLSGKAKPHTHCVLLCIIAFLCTFTYSMSCSRCLLKLAGGPSTKQDFATTNLS